jgi:hypothetical protein
MLMASTGHRSLAEVAQFDPDRKASFNAGCTQLRGALK